MFTKPLTRALSFLLTLVMLVSHVPAAYAKGDERLYILEFDKDVADEQGLPYFYLTIKDGFYDLDMIEAALTKAMDSYGGLELTVPAIPLISPQPKSMTFTSNDIRAMKRYMEG